MQTDPAVHLVDSLLVFICDVVGIFFTAEPLAASDVLCMTLHCHMW